MRNAFDSSYNVFFPSIFDSIIIYFKGNYEANYYLVYEP